MSQSSSSNPTRAYRTAAALNNHGVFLLQKGLCKDAMVLFKQAIVLMKSLYGSAATTEPDPAEVKALQESSNLCIAGIEMTSSTTPFPFQDITYYSKQPISLIDLTSYLSSENEANLIRIEVGFGCGSEHLTEADFLIETGIMMYNLATTTLCQFFQAQCEQSHSKNRTAEVDSRGSLVLQSAMRKYELLRCLLGRLLPDDCGEEDEGQMDFFYTVFATQLETLALSKMMSLVAVEKACVVGGSSPCRKVSFDEVYASLESDFDLNLLFLHENADYLTIFDTRETACAA